MAYMTHKELRKQPVYKFGDEMRVSHFDSKGAYLTDNPAQGAYAGYIDDIPHVVMQREYYLRLLNTENIVRLNSSDIFQLVFWVVSPSQAPFVCVDKDGVIMTTPQAVERFCEEYIEAGEECSLHIALEFGGHIINSMPVIVLRKGADLRTEIDKWGVGYKKPRRSSKRK